MSNRFVKGLAEKRKKRKRVRVARKKAGLRFT